MRLIHYKLGNIILLIFHKENKRLALSWRNDVRPTTADVEKRCKNSIYDIGVRIYIYNIINKVHIKLKHKYFTYYELFVFRANASMFLLDIILFFPIQSK